jgi:hypothetical protein
MADKAEKTAPAVAGLDDADSSDGEAMIRLAPKSGNRSFEVPVKNARKYSTFIRDWLMAPDHGDLLRFDMFDEPEVHWLATVLTSLSKSDATVHGSDKELPRHEFWGPRIRLAAHVGLSIPVTEKSLPVDRMLLEHIGDGFVQNWDSLSVVRRVVAKPVVAAGGAASSSSAAPKPKKARGKRHIDSSSSDDDDEKKQPVRNVVELFDSSDDEEELPPLRTQLMRAAYRSHQQAIAQKSDEPEVPEQKAEEKAKVSTGKKQASAAEERDWLEDLEGEEEPYAISDGEDELVDYEDDPNEPAAAAAAAVAPIDAMED